MKLFKLLRILIFIFSVIIFSGCNESSSKKNIKIENIEHICPQCNMPFSTNKDSTIYKNIKFDDIGCMILWAKNENLDLNNIDTQIYLNDEKIYINSKDAYYKINAKTPMNYGFLAVKSKCNNCIKFDEVILRMLRGEHLANPKIRKKILGY